MGPSPTDREFYQRPPAQVHFDVARRIHDLHVRQAKTVGVTPRTRALTLLEERFTGTIELLMLDVNRADAEIYLQIDRQPHRVSIQQLIDTGIDERASGTFYMTLIDPLGPRYVALFNPQLPEQVRDRVIWQVINTDSEENLTVNSYRYRYYEHVELRD